MHLSAMRTIFARFKWVIANQGEFNDFGETCQKFPSEKIISQNLLCILTSKLMFQISKNFFDFFRNFPRSVS